MFCRKTMLPFGSHQASLYRVSRQNRLKGHPQKGLWQRCTTDSEHTHTHAVSSLQTGWTPFFIITGGFIVHHSSRFHRHHCTCTGGFIIGGGRSVPAVSLSKVVNDAECRYPGEHRRLLVRIHHISLHAFSSLQAGLHAVLYHYRRFNRHHYTRSHHYQDTSLIGRYVSSIKAVSSLQTVIITGGFSLEAVDISSLEAVEDEAQHVAVQETHRRLDIIRGGFGRRFSSLQAV